MRNPLLPKAQAGFLDGAGRPLAEWRRFFESLSALTTETTLQAEIGAILARIGALESGGSGSVVGASSIVTYGDLTSGLTVTLSGDVSNPGASFNYGTDALGEKGWQTRTLADTGIGAALVRITRDAFGRVEGTQAATTADLTEGANLYYTAARADARIALGIAEHVAAADPHPQYLTPDEGAAAYAPLAHVGAGGAQHANAIAAGAAGFMTGADKTKLDGVAPWTSGNGTPEGALVADVGSMYTRLDGGAGTTLYVKETGTGSTGWIGK